MALEAIREQDEAVDMLRRALDGGRVAHAWAFIGPHGVGRRTTALAFAKALVAPAGAPRRTESTEAFTRTSTSSDPLRP